MKNLALFCFLISLSFTINAQSDSDSNKAYKNFISGNLRLSLSNTDANNTELTNLGEARQSFRISAGLGRQVNKHLSIIGNITYNYNQNANPIIIDNMFVTSRLLTSGIALSNSYRYTFNPNHKFQFAMQPGLSFSYSTSKREVDIDFAEDFRFSTYSAGLFATPIISYLLTRRIRLTASFGSIFVNLNRRQIEGSSNSTNSYNAGANLFSSIGGLGMEFLF